MPRYIDADALLENLKKQYGEELGWQCTVNMSDVGMMIEDAPAADVVQKSDVESLTKENERLMREKTALECIIGTARNQGKSEAKTEVAREIFEEIEELLKQTCEKGYCGSITDLLAELKKKYTEGDEGK